jgi:uncharacterized protein (TIGR02145 family)
MNRIFLFLFGAMTFAANANAQVPDYVPTEGLVAWYPFNGNANDESGNGYHCESFGAVLTDDRYGTPSSAFDFDGQGSHLRGASLPFLDLSISLWFMHDLGGYTYTPDPNSSAPTGAQLIGQGTAHVPCSWSDFAIGFADAPIGNDDLLAWEKSNAGGCSVQQSSANWPLETETWIHLIAISQGTQVDFFIDGSWVNSVEFEEPFNLTGSVFSIGARYVENCNGGEPCSGPGNAWNGAIDDVGFWNRALTDEEIQALYNAAVLVSGCTDPTACNFDAEATSDDGSCIPSGCMEALACNYNALAECAGEACDYTCCPGPGCCLEGTVWDAELGGCIPIEATCPEDLDFDGVVGVNDLMELLSAFGTDCPEPEEPATAEWTCGDPVSYHGYDYATVQIGEQCWFAENLRTEYYDNGEAIPDNLSEGEWSSTTSGAMAVYGENGDCSDLYPEGDACDPAWSLNEFGRLYNWFAVDDSRRVCPSGWHVPADEEWIILEMQLGMSEFEANNVGARGTDEGEQLKTAYGWNSHPEPGGNGTNLSFFSGLPCGMRDSNGNFEYAGNFGLWWSSSIDETFHAYRRQLVYSGHYVWRSGSDLNGGQSVRCLKD